MSNSPFPPPSCHGAVSHPMRRIMWTVLIFVEVLRLVGGDPSIEKVLSMRVRNFIAQKHDQYVCVSRKLETELAYAHTFQAKVELNHVHHMLLMACGAPFVETDTFYECREMGACAGHDEAIIWGSRRDGDRFTTPNGVGFPLGPKTGFRYLVLQIHYKNPFPPSEPPDNSGADIGFIVNKRRFKSLTPGGMFIAAHFDYTVPPNRAKTDVGFECCYDAPISLKGFAYRVHAHSLGVRNTMEVFNNNTDKKSKISRDTQKPQIFIPNPEMEISKGSVISAHCFYNSTNRQRTTRCGFTQADEMCNIYLMITENSNTKKPHMPSYMCLAGRRGSYMTYPDDSGVSSSEYPVQSRVNGVKTKEYGPKISKEPPLVWSGPTGPSSLKFGHVSAVDTDQQGNIWLFCRRGRVWDSNTFTDDNLPVDTRLIQEDTIMKVSHKGELKAKIGKNLFIMPHGLTLSENTLWVTDTGRHQVFQISVSTGKVLRVAGRKLKPGKRQLLCMPTDVAVSGKMVYVSVGYCDERVAVFRIQEGNKPDSELQNPSGLDYLRDLLGPSPPPRPLPDPHITPGIRSHRPLRLPHSIDLDPCGRPVVASRTLRRIYTFSPKRGEAIHVSETLRMEQSQIFSAKYLSGGTKIVVASNSARGSIIHVSASGDIISHININNSSQKLPPFVHPHDLAISQDGRTIYVAECGGTSPTSGRLWIFRMETQMKTQLEPHDSVIVTDGEVTVDPNLLQMLEIRTLAMIALGLLILIITVVLGYVMVSVWSPKHLSGRPLPEGKLPRWMTMASVTTAYPVGEMKQIAGDNNSSIDEVESAALSALGDQLNLESEHETSA